MTADSAGKPIVEFPGGEPPTDLKIEDIVVGEGPEAKAGDTVTVHYVGVEFHSGARIHMAFVHAMRPGQTPGRAYALPDTI